MLQYPTSELYRAGCVVLDERGGAHACPILPCIPYVSKWLGGRTRHDDPFAFGQPLICAPAAGEINQAHNPNPGLCSMHATSSCGIDWSKPVMTLPVQPGLQSPPTSDDKDQSLVVPGLV